MSEKHLRAEKSPKTKSKPPSWSGTSPKRSTHPGSELFASLELSRLYQHGQMDQFLSHFHSLVNRETLLATGSDVSVFRYDVDGQKKVLKVAPKTLRFFKHFGKHHSGKDFKKYINRLKPYFLPVDEIPYEDENFFVYIQHKCQLIESKRINSKVVIDLFRLIQFMLVNDILLTDLAPHNLGLLKGHVVVFDYHGLHRLTKEGQIKRPDWWRRLVRNLVRFVCGLYCPRKRHEYSLLMENCDTKVIQKMSQDPDIPECLTTLVEYLMTQENRASVPTVCEHLETCIKYIHTH